MRTFLWFFGAAAVGYLLGCMNMAELLSRAKGFDIREKGSGNAGASNALLTMGIGAAACTAAVDIGKAFLPVCALRWWIPAAAAYPNLPIWTGCWVILGHIFPFWLRFRGGKGYASLLGMALAVDWKLFLCFLVILAIILLMTKYIALATITCAAIFPLYRYITIGLAGESILLTLTALVIFWKHIPNLRRIRAGVEFDVRDATKK